MEYERHAKRPRTSPQRQDRDSYNMRLIKPNIRLHANYFKVGLGVDKFYIYDVKFDPPTDNRSFQAALIGQHQKFLGPFFFRGGNVWTLMKIEDTVLQSTAKKDGTVFSIKLTFASEGSTHSEMIRNLYNNFLKELMARLRFQQLGRNGDYFNPNDKKEFPRDGMEIWSGYSAAIAFCDGAPLLNANVLFKVLRTDNCLDFIRKCGRQEEIRNKIVGQIVLTRHNNRTYRIADVDFSQSPLSTFTLRKDNQQISFKEYNEKVLNLRVTDDRQPLLVVRFSRRGEEAQEIRLIPEACTLTGLAGERMPREVSSHTQITPIDRSHRIEEIVNKISSSTATKPHIAEAMKAWKFDIGTSMLEVEGKVFPDEELQFRNRSLQTRGARWSNFTRENVEFVAPMDLSRWLVICSQRDMSHTKELVRVLGETARQFGMPYAEPDKEILQNDSPNDFVNAFRAKVRVVDNVPSHSLVLFILPSSLAKLYSDIKSLMATECSVPTQCVQSRTVKNTRDLRTLCTNLIQQMNVKMGGAVWDLFVLLPHPTIVIGVDVSPMKGAQGGYMMGLVASMNRSVTKYWSTASRIPSREELKTKLASFVTRAALTFFEQNNVAPEKIIIYREGAGESQLKEINDNEVIPVKEALDNLSKEKGTSLSLSYIVVQQRTTTRLFSQRGNPPPGTVVDSKVNRSSPEKSPEKFDFYLISQPSGRGTVSPTHYHVLWNSDNPPHILQWLSYKLTHLYANWAGTVSVPAPLKYAMKCSSLFGRTIGFQGALAERLEDKIFYI